VGIPASHFVVTDSLMAALFFLMRKSGFACPHASATFFENPFGFVEVQVQEILDLPCPCCRGVFRVRVAPVALTLKVLAFLSGDV